MTLTPKVRQIAFGVYVAIRNSGDAYFLSSRQIGISEPFDYQVIIKHKSAEPHLAGRRRITDQQLGQTCNLVGTCVSVLLFSGRITRSGRLGGLPISKMRGAPLEAALPQMFIETQ